ncbi:MAG: hypothetical protein JSR71_11965 [Proteobacteria bacterium]|nr:hypothetical protein [Pseudomonadota bacterium]
MFRFLLISIVLLSGCTTTPQPIPAELQYVPPAGQEGSLANLIGSKQKGALPDDERTAYVLAVDGKRVMSGQRGWNSALPIQPGQRSVTVAFQGGAFHTQVDLQMQAVAGGSYQIQFSTDVQLFGANTYCDLWIIDTATQKPASGIGCGNLVNPNE